MTRYTIDPLVWKDCDEDGSRMMTDTPAGAYSDKLIIVRDVDGGYQAQWSGWDTHPDLEAAQAAGQVHHDGFLSQYMTVNMRECWKCTKY